MRWFDHPFALFEDNLSDNARLIILSKPINNIRAHTPEDVPTALAAIESALAEGCWLAFAGHYELGAALERSLHALVPENSDAPLLQAWVFTHRAEHTADAVSQFWQQALAALDPAEREAVLLHLQPSWDEIRHQVAATRILDWIHAGDCYQANLTFPLFGETGGHPLALFERLRAAQPVSHGALLFDGESWILSRSPELFVTRRGATLTCRPMKGTAARQTEAFADSRVACELQHSDKDRAENLMIVDLIRNDLGRLAPAGGVRVERMFELETFPSVHQLTSTVSATPVSAGFAGVLAALYPCGSVTGAPKIRAMQIIHAVEDGPRGLYCGALGWLAPDGDFSLNVPIRTLLIDKNRRSRLDVGSGIVADSDPAAEYRECLAKARFISDLDNNLELIETLRWEASGYPMLAAHLARLHASATQLGFVFNAAAAHSSLLETVASTPDSPQRVRLTLTRKGHLHVERQPLAELSGQQFAAIAPFRLASNDPRLRHKTTARGFYDAALREAIREGLFDLIFCNERGELCEGARSNLFLEMDDGLLHTPALRCGLLPGVLRASLLAQGLAVESILNCETLFKARQIWLGNALRGLVPVRLISTPQAQPAGTSARQVRNQPSN